MMEQHLQIPPMAGKKVLIHPLPLAGEGQSEGGYDIRCFPPHLHPLPRGERKLRGFIF